MTPKRVFDTRPGQSPESLRSVPKQRIGGANVLEVQVTDIAGVGSASQVGAVSLNVTIDGPAAAGFVTVYPCNQRKLVSSVNFVGGQTVANAVIAPISAAGTVCFYSNVDTDVIADVNGWFAKGAAFTPVGPARILDTRPGNSPEALLDVPKQRIGGAAVLTAKVLALPGGLVPASGVGAVSLNVTVDGPAADGFLTVYPCQGDRPFVSSVNFVAGQTVANAVVTPVSGAGTVCFFSNVETDVIVDVNGWLKAVSGFHAVSPARLLDTRPGQSPEAKLTVEKARIGGAKELRVKVAGFAGVPASGAKAVSINVTAVGPDGFGFLTVYPCGTRELVSNVNFAPGAVVPNAVITPLSAGGEFCVYSSQNTDVVVDVNGWFA